MAIHDHEFNDMWIRSWTRRQVGFGIGAIELDKIKDQVCAIYLSDTGYINNFTLI